VAGQQDPAYPDPQFHGIPVTRASELETVEAYDGGSNVAVNEQSSGTATKVGPRYYWFNTECLYPVFHDEMYFKKGKVTESHNVPDTHVCPVSTWVNFFNPVRRKQGIVYPAVNGSTLY
jgi:hypothetical protein